MNMLTRLVKAMFFVTLVIASFLIVEVWLPEKPEYIVLQNEYESELKPNESD